MLELTQYSPLKSEIEALAATNKSLVFDYADKKGAENARSHIYKMRTKKGDVERTRKELKADALEFGRKVDAAAKELTEALESMIQVHQGPLDAIAEKEKARMAEIAGRMDRIRAVVPSAAAVGTIVATGNGLDELRDTLAALRVATPDGMDESTQEWIDARDAAVEAIAGIVNQAAQAMADRAEIARQRQELADMQRKQAEAQAQADREKAVREASDRAKAEAEAKAKADQDKADQAIRDAEKQAFEAEQALQRAAIASERAKLDADRLAIEEARLADGRLAAEKERARVEAEQAAEKAKADQEAAVKQAHDDARQAEQARRDAEAREAEHVKAEQAAREKDQANQRAAIKEIAASIKSACPDIEQLAPLHAEMIAAGIVAGKIARVRAII